MYSPLKHAPMPATQTGLGEGLPLARNLLPGQATGSGTATDAEQHVLQRAVQQLEQVLLGKPEVVRLALTCVLANGHLLIEDLPGMGKTTLASGLARVLGLEYNRLQFTADLLPSDITGSSIFDRDSGSFRFKPGPVFTQVLLADEINRAPPKAQSALLEAMEERQVSGDGGTLPLPSPFFVIATQNPQDQHGTYPLPESQSDRFLLCIRIGYPDAQSERELLLGQERRTLPAGANPALNASELLALQRRAAAVHLSDALLDYVQALLAATRQPGRFVDGLSPRGGLALVRAARARALLEGRDHVLPEDIQAVWMPLVRHRLQPLTLPSGFSSDRDAISAALNQPLRDVPVV